MPDLEEVVSVGVLHLEEPDVFWNYEITDARRIDELLTHFRKHNTGFRADTRLHEWIHGPRHHHEYALAFKGEEDTPLMVWIGSDWLGGMDLRKGEPWTERYRWLSPEERQDLLAMIGERDRHVADPRP
ncbi:MAG TPA: hypothetical protein VF121_15470 [Thermoanaerobaculia bacterium]|nr:hypothetical protein [Thermoanaerobaculia bacterium]